MSEARNNLPEEPERRGLGGRFGVIGRVRLGRTALLAAAVEVPAGIVSAVIGSPDPIIISTTGTLWVGGETLYTLYNNRNQPHEQIPGTLAPWLAKEDPAKPQG